MTTADGDPNDGERIDGTYTVRAHERLRTDGDVVHRLAVTDEADRTFAVLVSVDHDPAFATGATYRFQDLVWSDPAPEAGEEGECPECGGPAREGCGADAVDRAVSRVASGFDPDEVDGTTPAEGLAVVDGDTNVEGLAIEGAVGDERQHDRARILSPRVPSHVCVDCGCGIADGLFGGVDESRGPQRIVDFEDPIADPEDGTDSAR
jgi:hypothetical protein